MELPSLRIAIDERLGDVESLEVRVNLLEKLDEIRSQAYLNTVATQKWRISYYDSKMIPKNIGPTDLVLFYDSRFQKFPGKFGLHWLGPYKVHIIYSNGSLDLKDFSGNILPTRLNGNRLKVYRGN